MYRDEGYSGDDEYTELGLVPPTRSILPLLAQCSRNCVGTDGKQWRVHVYVVIRTRDVHSDLQLGYVV